MSVYGPARIRNFRMTTKDFGPIMVQLVVPHGAFARFG